MRNYNVGDIFKTDNWSSSAYEITYIRDDGKFNIHQVDSKTHERFKSNGHGNFFFYWEKDWVIVKPVVIPPMEDFL